MADEKVELLYNVVTYTEPSQCTESIMVNPLTLRAWSWLKTYGKPTYGQCFEEKDILFAMRIAAGEIKEDILTIYNV